jgi:hypothetical protein
MVMVFSSWEDQIIMEEVGIVSLNWSFEAGRIRLSWKRWAL